MTATQLPATSARQAPEPSGLSSNEASRRLTRFGPNTLETAPARSIARDVVGALANPLMLVLLVSSVVAAGVGELVDATIIVVMVLLSVALNVVQSSRSRSAAERLRQSIAPTATALRDGVWREVPRSELVPGDVVRLAAGDLIPGDGTLLDSRDLHVQEAALTGESLPAEKESARDGETDVTLRNRIFLGTSVVTGTGTAVITSTGCLTSFGAIAARLRERAPPTEFDRGLTRLGALITRTVLFLVLFLVAVSIALHRPPLESLLFAVALAVGLVPEFMPMITSVTLANGAVRMAGAKVIVRHLGAIQNLGSIDVLCSDKTGTLTVGEMTVEQSVDLEGAARPDVLVLAGLNSRFETGIRSPLDLAILRAAEPEPAEHEKLDEIPFDFERRRSSIVVRRAHDRILVSKGAPESIARCCDRYAVGSRIRPLDDAALAILRQQVQRLGAAGLRVLGVAWRTVTPQAAYSRADEHDLIYAGLLAFSDPPLPDAAATIAALRELGVAVKILSGDEATVARNVCQRTGIDASRILVGDEIDRMSDAALAHVAEEVSVFARVSPQQKNRILLALKSRKHVVGYLGDGINDAPSPHTADVGISVSTAVDVAKDTADIILLERSLGVLRVGILEGRKAFGNVMKYLLMGTSSNFGNMFSMAVASLALPFLPMLPTQILLNNFLYDLAQVAIPTDHVDTAYTRRPQRWNIQALRRFMITIGPVSSVFDFITFGVLLLVFRANEAAFHTGWFTESLVTQTLVLFVIRSPRSAFRSRPSRALVWTVCGCVALGVSLPFTPLAAPLGFVRPPASFLGFVVVITVAYLVCVELVKRPLMTRMLA